MNTDMPRDDERKQILFVCTGNTCRSVLAEYIARKKFGTKTEYASAGLYPGSREDVKNAIFTLKHLFDMDASGHAPHDVRDINIDKYDLVIALSKEVATELQGLFPDFPAERLMKWNINDPYGHDLTEYETCAFDINKELRNLFLKKEIG